MAPLSLVSARGASLAATALVVPPSQFQRHSFESSCLLEDTAYENEAYESTDLFDAQRLILFLMVWRDCVRQLFDFPNYKTNDIE